MEKIHYSYFEEAFEAVREGKNPETVDYYVCQVCGNTVAGSAPDKCPICGAVLAAFKKIE